MDTAFTSRLSRQANRKLRVLTNLIGIGAFLLSSPAAAGFSQDGLANDSPSAALQAPLADWDPRLDAFGIYREEANVPEGTFYWKLTSARYEDDTESGGNHSIYYKVLDETGDPIEGQPAIAAWPTGNPTDQTTVHTKGVIDGYWGDFAMAGNNWCPFYPEGPRGPYGAYVAGGPSDQVWGMGMPCNHHVNYRLVWQWSRKGSSPSPTPPAPPATLSTPPYAIGLDPGAPVDEAGGGISFPGAAIQESGSKWVRINFILGPWSSPDDTTPRGPDSLTWFQTYDRIIDDAIDRGLRPYGLIGEQAVHTSSPINSEAYVAVYTANFVTIVDHFKDRIRYFESFNEPNNWVGPSTPKVAESIFARMLEQIYRAVKVAHWDEPAWRDITLITGPLLSHDIDGGDTGASYFSATVEYGRDHLGWNDLKTTHGTFPFDGIGYHLYVAGGTGDPDSVRAAMNTNLNAIWGGLTALEGSSTAKRLWVSEIGWRTESLSEEDQADNVDTALDLLRGDLRVAMTSWFCLRDFGDLWGLERSDGSKKPGWYRFVAQAALERTDQAPVATGQSVTVPAGSSLDIQLQASDPQGDPLTFSIVAPPSHGTLTGTQDGDAWVTYAPSSGYAGSDAFTFKANDGTFDSNVATVSITVSTANRPPVAEDINGNVTTGNSLLVHLQASDPDGDPLTYHIVSPPSHGAVTDHEDDDEWVTYAPEAGYLGDDAFTYKANDGVNDSNVATVSITVTDASNSPPVAEDQSLMISGSIEIELEASDPDGDPLTYSIVSQPTHGTLADANEAWITYTPQEGFDGQDSFTFKANDGIFDSNVATVRIATALWSDPVRINEILTFASAKPAVAVQGNSAYAVWVDEIWVEEDQTQAVVLYFNRSSDGGHTWGAETTQVTPPLAKGLGIDGPPSIDVDPEGAVYVAWNAHGYDADNLPVFQNHLARSGNGGQTWQEVYVNQEVSTRSLRVGAGPNGRLLLGWYQNGRIWVTRSLDRGENWSAATIVGEVGGECDGDYDLASAGSGVAYVVITSCGQVWLAKSVDDGWSWTDPELHDIRDAPDQSTMVYSPAIATHGPNDVFAVWIDERQSPPAMGDVFFAASHDSGGTWTRNIHVNAFSGSLVDIRMPDIAAFSDSHLAIGWASQEVQIAESADGGMNWNGVFQSSGYRYGARGSFSLAADPSGTALAAWHGEPEDCSNDPKCYAKIWVTARGRAPTSFFDLELSAQALTLNDSGWYAQNPLLAQTTLNCPADHGGPCRGELALDIGNPDETGAEYARFYVAQADLLPEEGFTCVDQLSELLCTQDAGIRIVHIQADGASPVGLNTYRSYRFKTSPLEVPAGSSATYLWKVWVQPQEANTLNVAAWWDDLDSDQDYSDSASTSFPTAQIHPLVFLPGAGATHPPSYNQTLADALLLGGNIFGHYFEFYDALERMGYEKGTTYFLFPYDWLSSNMTSAQHLRDDRLIPAAQIAATVPWVKGYADPTAVDFDLVGHSNGTLVARAYIQGDSWNRDVRRYVSIAGPHLGVGRSYISLEGIEPAPDPMDRSVYFLWAPLRARLAGYGRVVCLPLLGCRWTWNIEDRYQFAHDPIHGLTILPDLLPTYQEQTAYLVNENGVPSQPSGSFPFGRMANPLLEDVSSVDHVSVLDPWMDNPHLTSIPEGFLTNYQGLNTEAGMQRLAERLGDVNENVCIIFGSGSGLDTSVSMEVREAQDNAPYWFNGTVENHNFGLGDRLIPSVSANPSGIWQGGTPHAIDIDGILAGEGRPEAEHATMVGYDQTIIETARCLTHLDVPEQMLSGYSSGEPMASSTLRPLREPSAAAKVQSAEQTLVISGAGPVELTLTDPQGRRLGYNPGGDDFTEIPSGFYVRDSQADQKHLIVYEPIDGNYVLDITGTANGDYLVIGSYQDGDQVVNLLIQEGTIEAGTQQTVGATVPANIADYPVPPEVDAGPDRTAKVGEGVAFAGTVTDINPGDTHQYTWDFGDGDTAEGSLTLIHAYSKVGVYTVTLTVVDSAGFTVSDSLVVTVEGVGLPPTAAGDTYEVDEDNVLEVSAPGVLTNDHDPDQDPLSVILGAGTQHGSLTLNPDGSFSYGPQPDFNGEDAFTYAAFDGSQPSQPAAVTLTVNSVNDSPALEIGSEASLDEGQSLTRVGSFRDPDVEDTWTASVDWGDGQVPQDLAPQPDKSFVLEHIYVDDGSYTVSVIVTDGQGGQGSDSVGVTVVNVAPRVEAGDNLTGVEGQPISFSGSFIDPGVQDTHTLAWDLGDGAAAEGTLTPIHTYTGSGTFSATLTVTDDDGAAGSDTVQVVIQSPAEPSQDLADYVLFASEYIRLGSGAVVRSGNIGVNKGPDGSASPEIVLPSLAWLAPGVEVAADSLRLGPLVMVNDDLFYNDLETHPWARLLGERHSPLGLPLVDLPNYPPFQVDPSARNVFVFKNMDLAAGDYGTVAVWPNRTLRLTGGVYELRLLHVWARGQVVCVVQCDIRVQDRISLGRGARLMPAAGQPPASLRVLLATPSGVGLDAAGNNLVWANVFAPRSELSLGVAGDFRGAFVARRIEVGPLSRFTLAARDGTLGGGGQ